MTRDWRPCAAALLCACLAAGCDLTAVTTAPGQDVVVVEGVLRTDLVTQQVLLHRTVDGALASGVPGARVTVTGTAGDVHRLVAGTGCYQIDVLYARSDSLDFEGSCYVTTGQDVGWVRPGQSYDLRVETPDGRVIQGRTQVPGAYAVPSVRTDPELGPLCSLAPDSAFRLVWTQSAGAWSYVADLSISGLAQSLAGRGFRVADPMLVRGVSISQADTTLVLPTEFGVFERLQYDSDLLLAIRNGFPEGTRIELVLAAADRNWVNSVRGGSFNPSGLVRISTVVGDGVGVFASLNAQRAVVTVRRNTAIPRCGVR
ncbi:MAG TPA: hypothetical protein VGO40_12700 [Longimicrobium sp.]|jgi:hypothetical protein|nr:hypothetical protein [Longimicrobium sp.]